MIINKIIDLTNAKSSFVRLLLVLSYTSTGSGEKDLTY